MIPRVPSSTNLRACNTPPSRVSTCNAFADIGHYLQQEAVVEGVLHVSAAQAHSCMQRFEDLEGPSAPALPALPGLLAATAAHSADDLLPALTTPTPSALITVSSTGERVMQEAFCLATPPDNPAENSSILREPVPGAARTSPAAPSPTGSNTSNTVSNNNSSSSSQPGRASEPAGASLMRRAPSRGPSNSSLLVREAEEVSQLEVAACQHTAAIGPSGLNSSVLKASEAMARLRRRKLRQLLRNTRDASTTLMTSLQQLQGDPGFLLASIGDSLATLSSWDTDSVGAASEADSSSSISHTWTAEQDLSIEEEYLGWYADPSTANTPHRGCKDCCGTCHFAC